MKSISKIKEIFENGQNVMEYLRDANSGNDIETILISYDLQAGSYIEIAKKNVEYIDKYTNSIATVMSALGTFDSIMEVGVGEATNMVPLMKKLDPENRLLKFGFDISWSRLRYAKEYCQHNQIGINLFLSNLFQIALPDNSVDIVYTSHSLEPNGGNEKNALSELYRVASKYVVLLEPNFENATEEGKQRITKNGYVRDLEKHAIELGYKIIVHRPFDIFINPLNPTALTIIEKESLIEPNSPKFVCPVSRTNVEIAENLYYSDESGLLYPIINGIPCLLESSATIGTHFKKFNNSYGY